MVRKAPPTRTPHDTRTPRSAAPHHGSAPRPRRGAPAGSRQPNPARGASAPPYTEFAAWRLHSAADRTAALPRNCPQPADSTRPVAKCDWRTAAPALPDSSPPRERRGACPARASAPDNQAAQPARSAGCAAVAPAPPSLQYPGRRPNPQASRSSAAAGVPATAADRPIAPKKERKPERKARVESCAPASALSPRSPPRQAGSCTESPNCRAGRPHPSGSTPPS